VNIPKKVLIIRFSSIGDIVLCSPVIRCVKKQWGSEIHFITKEKFVNIISESPYIDKVISIKEKVSEVSSVLKNEKYDLVIDLHKNIRSQQVRSIVRTGYKTFNKINIQKWITVNTPLQVLPKNHLIDRYFKGLASTGLKYDGKGLDHFTSEKDKKDAEFITPKTYCVLSLGATYATKRLPLTRLIKLVSYIQEPIVLIGGNDVKHLANDLQETTNKELTNLVGKISIGVSSAVIANAQYVVSGDSGMMHIAAAHRKPLIVPWGSTHTSLGMYPFYPTENTISYVPLSLNLSCQPCSKIGKETCPKGHFNCMKDITDKMLANAVSAMEKSV